MLVTFLLSICFALAQTRNSLLVKLPQLGHLEGYYEESLNGNVYFAFEGVPYARPPIGKYRFEESEPPKPWNGVYQAKTAYLCMQRLQYSKHSKDDVVGEEDCLYINIYTPTIDPNAKLDVIVYLHDGSSMFFHLNNERHYNMMNRNVIYVTINYRLGSLGFLSTNVVVNNGFKDQILALTFIKKYINFFGGNPKSITVIGTLARGASVYRHYLSPKSQGLFNRNVSQGKTSLNPWVLMEKPLEKCKILAENVGCPTTDIAKIIKCLKSRPARQIVAQVETFQPWHYDLFAPFAFVANTWSKDPLLPDLPLALIKKRKVKDFPWIGSETYTEKIHPAADFEYIDYIDNNWNSPHILDYNFTAVNLKHQNQVSQVKKLTRDNFPKLINMLTKRKFFLGNHQAAELQSAAVNSSVYFYYFTFHGEQSWHQEQIRQAENASFFSSSFVSVIYTKADRLMIDFFVNLFSDHARQGVPRVSFDWKPISQNKNRIQSFKIDSLPNFGWVQIWLKNNKFWNSLLIIENNKLVKLNSE